MACALAEAGIHLLTEKPLSTNLNDTDRLHQIIERKQVVAAAAYVYRTFPICTFQEGLQTLRCNLAVLNAVEQGTWQTVRNS